LSDITSRSIGHINVRKKEAWRKSSCPGERF